MLRQIPAIDGWFTTGDDSDPPRLLGHRCAACATYAFPFAPLACPNPACRSTEFATVPLSRTGTIWSYTDARYQPPAPYVAAEPYEPFCIAAVELTAEGLVVLGQVVAGVTVDQLAVGMEVELVVDTLDVDEEAGEERLIWKWLPVGVAR